MSNGLLPLYPTTELEAAIQAIADVPPPTPPKDDNVGCPILPDGWTWGEIAEGFLIGAGTAGTAVGKAITLSTVGEWLKGLDDDCPDDFLGEPLMPTGKRRNSTYGNSHPEGKFGGAPK